MIPTRDPSPMTDERKRLVEVIEGAIRRFHSASPVRLNEPELIADALLQAGLVAEPESVLEKGIWTLADVGVTPRGGHSETPKAWTPIGWKLVPEVPTVEMVIAATEQWLCIAAMEDRAEVIWDVMLAVAPEPPTEIASALNTACQAGAVGESS